MLIVDSNIWAYYFDKDAPEHARVAGKLEEMIKAEKIAINTVIIMEVGHFLVKNLGAVIGRDKVEVFLSFPFTVVDMDYDLALKAVELLAKYSHHGIGGRDATILATAKALGLNRIMTHDRAFERIDWLEVIDPLSE